MKEGNMPSKNESTPSNELTLKDIEEHLKWQDRQMAQGAWLTTAIFGSSVIMIAISLQVGKILSLTDARYIFLVALGFGVMAWARWKVRKIKN